MPRSRSNSRYACAVVSTSTVLRAMLTLLSRHPCPRVHARVLAASRLFCPCSSYPAYHTSDFFSVPRPILCPVATLGEVTQSRTGIPCAERFTQNCQGQCRCLCIRAC